MYYVHNSVSLNVCNNFQAAEFGKMLLENNEDLKTDMDELRKSYDKKLEVGYNSLYKCLLLSKFFFCCLISSSFN